MKGQRKVNRLRRRGGRSKMKRKWIKFILWAWISWITNQMTCFTWRMGEEKRYITIITNDVHLITIRKGDLSRSRKWNDQKNTRRDWGVGVEGAFRQTQRNYTTFYINNKKEDCLLHLPTSTSTAGLQPLAGKSLIWRHYLWVASMYEQQVTKASNGRAGIYVT
jgi:hypothetical protein